MITRGMIRSLPLVGEMRTDVAVPVYPIGSPCPTFLNPGPPGYAAQCLLRYGHEGDHRFPTVEECRKAYYESMGWKGWDA